MIGQAKLDHAAALETVLVAYGIRVALREDGLIVLPEQVQAWLVL